MKVQIIGAGSIGLLTASYLLEAGFDVTIICRTKRQSELLRKKGLVRIDEDGTKSYRAVKASSEMTDNAELTIVTTKAYHVEALYQSLNQLPEQSVLLFMQNGLAHYEKALKLRQQHIAFASVQFGALKEADNVVRHTGIGMTKVAVAKGERGKFALPIAIEKFPIQEVSDAFSMLFEKALLNCFINPLTAILQVNNGVLIENNYALAVMRKLYEELKLVFREEMQRFTFEQVTLLCETTARNRSSMLMDRVNHRLSEVDAIVLPIIKLAQDKGMTLPTLQVLYNLVRALEVERERQA